jgi:hypothetical protein
MASGAYVPGPWYREAWSWIRRQWFFRVAFPRTIRRNPKADTVGLDAEGRPFTREDLRRGFDELAAVDPNPTLVIPPSHKIEEEYDV